jgi:hypothetical protein
MDTWLARRTTPSSFKSQVFPVGWNRTECICEATSLHDHSFSNRRYCRRNFSLEQEKGLVFRTFVALEQDPGVLTRATKLVYLKIDIT